MAAGDIYRLLAVFENSTTTERLTIGFHGIQPAAAAPDVDVVGPDVKDWWIADLGAGTKQRDKHYTNISLVDVRLRRVKPLEAVEFSYTTGLPSAGTALNGSMPPGVACVCSLRTAKIGRSFRGRVYLPPLGTGKVDQSGGLSGGVGAAMDAQMTEFFNTLVVDNFIPAVYSRVLDSAEAITSVRVDERLRDQRRRTVRQPDYA